MHLPPALVGLGCALILSTVSTGGANASAARFGSDGAGGELPDRLWMAQVSAEDPSRPRREVVDSIMREIWKLPGDEGAKYAALFVLFAQPYVAPVSAAAVPAIKKEVLKDVLFAVARGVVHSDYIRERAGVRGQRLLDLHLATLEGTLDFGMFLSSVSDVVKLKPGELAQLVGTLPSTVTDLLDAKEAATLQTSSVRFLITFAKELLDECDFEFANDVVGEARKLLPRLRVRETRLTVEIRAQHGLLTGRAPGVPLEQLPRYWRDLPYRAPLDPGPQGSTAAGDAYNAAMRDYPDVVRTRRELEDLLQKAPAAESQYRSDRARVTQLLADADRFLWACEAARGDAALAEIAQKMELWGYPGPLIGSGVRARSFGCWGWAEAPLRKIHADYEKWGRTAAELPRFIDGLYAEGARALGACRLGDAATQLQLFERNLATETGQRFSCIEQRYNDLRREFEAMRQSGVCDKRDASVRGSARVTPRECAVPLSASKARKQQIHAKIGRYAPERKRGGDEWHPDYTFRAGRLVGSVDLPATGPQLDAMEQLVDDYHGCHQPYWQFREAVVPVMQREARFAYQYQGREQGDAITKRIREGLDRVTLELRACIKRTDDAYAAAMERAKAICK